MPPRKDFFGTFDNKRVPSTLLHYNIVSVTLNVFSHFLTTYIFSACASEYPRKTNPYTYLNMNDAQKMKTKLRNSKAWKDLRKRFKKEQKLDPITLKPLTNRFNLHHRDLDETHYCDLSNDDHFVALNPTSHDLVHFLFNIVKREQSYDVLDRIKIELQKMAEINLSAH